MIYLYNIVSSTVTQFTSAAMAFGKSVPVDEGPVVTYVSVTYMTATDVAVVVTTDVTITLSTFDSVTTDAGTSSASSLSIVVTPTSPPSDSTRSSSVGLTSTSSSFTTSSSVNSASPASATSSAPNISTTSILSMPEPSGSGLSRGGVIGIAIVLVILLLALIMLWFYYRRQKKSYKEAMLIAPRPSNFEGFRFFEMDHKPSSGHGSGGESFERDTVDTTSVAVHAEPPLYKSWGSLGHAEGFTRHKHSSDHQPELRFSDRFPWSINSSEFPQALTRQHRSLESNFYGMRYDLDGTLVPEYEPTQYIGPKDNRWNEALQRLNALHLGPTGDLSTANRISSTVDQIPPQWNEALQGLNMLRNQLSPPPLRIVKRCASNPEHEIQPPPMTLRHMRPDLESNSEAYQFSNQTERDRLRAITLAKLEGRYSSLCQRYASDSVYSQTSDGTLINNPMGSEGRPHWKKLESLWPDDDEIHEENMDNEDRQPIHKRDDW